ncbi:MAG: substrate-binding domain-containing protein [Alphaproteobacteria bacterium]|nr:substrate-binding domain-containing protein [Alphaproteobacteria bacterium]
MKLLFAVVCVIGMSASQSIAADVTLLSAGAVREVVEKLIPAFESTSGHRVIVQWSGSADINKRVTGGEIADVVIINGTEIDTYISKAILAAGSRVDLMKSRVGIAVGLNQPIPDVSTPELVKAAILNARAIGYSTGYSGVHIEEMMKTFGVMDLVASRMKRTASGSPVGAILANGDVDLGFQQVSELIHFPGIRYVGPLPAALQNVTVFSAGLHAKAAQPDAARRLMSALSSPTAAHWIRQYGMEEPDRR